MNKHCKAFAFPSLTEFVFLRQAKMKFFIILILYNCDNQIDKCLLVFTLQSLVITNDVVKIYRNYLIVYTLKAVNTELSNCISFN